MLRPSLSPRLILGLALALFVGAGVGLSAVSLWPSSPEGITPVSRAEAAEPAGPTTAEPAAPEAEPPAPAESAAPAESSDAPASPRVTLDEAKAIAVKAAGAGRVVEIDDDHEPTGLRYDVTVLHDNRTSTEVEVDATTGEVTSIDHDDDWD